MPSSDQPFSIGDVSTQLIKHATGEFAAHSIHKSLPKSVESRVYGAALVMFNRERMAQSDIDEAKAAFDELIKFCTRRASQESRLIDEDDFSAAIHSHDAYWPYGGYKSVLNAQH